MAKIRKDLVGTVLAVNEHAEYKSLSAGATIPEGFFVGGHAVEGGNVADQTPPWGNQAGAVAAVVETVADGFLERLLAEGATAQEAVDAVAKHLGVEILDALDGAAGVESGGAEIGDETAGSDETRAASTDDADQAVAVTIAVPPRAGAGSSADVWRTYAIEATKARGLNIELPDDASRADIIAALNGAGIPTE